MRYLFSILIFLLSFPTIAQQDSKRITVSGTILEKGSNFPLEYATISFIDNAGKVVTGGITDIDGKYNIKIPAGIYTVRFEFISFETQELKNEDLTSDKRFSTIYLDMDSASLDEVVVRAETTEVQVRLDKKIYNIGKDLTAGGATVSDALNNVPSVTVDVDGAIALRGSENVKILINGKPSAMAGFGSTDVLQQLPAESIERVEVITSPSARYDAEGTAGILNIILKKEKTLGLNGSISGNISDPFSAGVTGNVNLRTEKFNIFNTTGYYYRDFPGSGTFDNHYLSRTVFDSLGNPITIDPQFDRVREERKNSRLRKGFNTNLGIEYFLTESSSITASGFFRSGKNNNNTTNNVFNYKNNQLVEQNIRTEDGKGDNHNLQFALNYENKFDERGDHKLTTDLQYETSKNDNNSFIWDEITLPNYSRLPSEDIADNQKRTNYLAQIDYVRPINENGQFEAGYRGDFSENITDYVLMEEVGTTNQYERNDDISNIFTHEQNVHAIYAQYGNKLSEKVSFLLGLRMENTQIKGKVDAENLDTTFPFDLNFNKNYTGLFPTVNLTYELAENENLTLGYNRRINRPWRWFLNPFPSRSSEANVFQGNPDLDPAYASAFDLGYLNRFGKLTLTSSIYFQYETDSFERVQEETGEVTSNGVNIIRTLPINLSTNQRYGFELGLMYNPFKWWSLNGSFNYYKFETKGFFNDVDYGAKSASYFGRFSSKIKLPAKMEWQANAFYRGPHKNAQTKSDGMLSVDLALSKELFNDNATLSVNVSDLLNTRKRSSFTSTDFFTSESEFQWRPRTITLNFTYRFNQTKFQERMRQRMERRQGNGMDDEPGFEG